MSTTATRSFEFDAAHRVLGHTGKCRFLHGHRYRVEVTVKAKELDDLGMVVDFSCIKEKLQPWIDEHWDHNVLLNENDPLFDLKPSDQLTVFGDKEPLVFADNPTAEIIAEQFGLVAQRAFTPLSLSVVGVRIYETPNCWADWSPSCSS